MKPLVWDNHACPSMTRGAPLDMLYRYRTAGVTVVSLNVGYGPMPAEEILNRIHAMRAWIEERPEHFRLVATADDVALCRADGRLGIAFDVEGMDPVLHDPTLIEPLYALGVRWMLIAYNRSNAAGGGCLDEDRGLTARGRAVIDMMERVGMVLCLSHAGHRTARDALEYSVSPPIYSHSNPSGDLEHPRNVPDAMLLACADKGGVIGLSGFGAFLGRNGDLVAGLVRQLRHVVDLVGANHVGLGLDFVFDRAELGACVRADPGLFPFGVEGGGPQMIEPEAVGDIADQLAKVGLNDREVRGIMGENWLRHARQVWKSEPSCAF